MATKVRIGRSGEQSTSFVTEKEALAIPPPIEKTHVEHWSKADPCFGIRVMRANAKTGKVTRTWLVGWYEGVHHRRQKIGRVGKVSYHAAHKAALDKIDEVRKKKEGASGGIPTFEQAYKSYVERKVDNWAPDTLANYQKSIGYILPVWGARRVDEITEDEATALYHAIRNGVKERNGRDGRATAVSSMRLAKTIFSDLARRKKISVNPCVGLVDDGVFKSTEPRSRMIPAQQLPVFWRWLHTHPAPPIRDYILMGLLMALRQRVLASLRWSNLAQTGDRFYYVLQPDQRGNKRRQDIPMPIPTYLVETVIKPRLASPTKHHTWIIESPKHYDQPLRSVKGTYEAFAAKTKLKVSDHDMRRTIATLTNALCGPILAQRILTHSVQARDVRHATTSGYVITEEDELLVGMNKVVDYILGHVNAAPSESVQGATTASADTA